MELPTPKPVAEIEAMKEERRQGYKNNRQSIIDHLKTRGLSNAAIAGIVGNIDIETGGTFDYQQRQTKSGNPRDPNVTPGGAYGLFQFDDPGKKAGHETWYKQYLEKTNKTDSAESQLDYFLDTVNAAADKQNPFYSFSENVGTGNTGTIKGYFQLSEDPKTVSDSITDRFLKPGKPKSDKRRASAEATFAELQPIDPDNQNIDQPGDIVDTGEDTPMMSEPESRFKYVPILRHFMDEGGMSTKFNPDIRRNYPVTEEMMELMENMTEEQRRKLIADAIAGMQKGERRTEPLSEDAIKRIKDLRRNYNEGGIAKQMELFEDGGLMDEGGTVDPVSGNDVPFGSMQEEVRDDIPAQLSEGEFVFPADVVRFIGLNNLMQMRQQAKMGLKEMEAMGQMGNSEEATMPDDLPFDINDLDMEDEPEYNVGGFVPGQGFASIPPGIPTPREQVANQQFGIAGYTPATAPTTGAYQPPPMSVAPAPVQAASAQFAAPPRPQQVTTPMIQYQKPDIPFQQFIGGGVEGVEAETVQYKNEAGDIITRRISKATGELIPGQPPIPDGYVKFDPNAPEKEEVTTTPTTTQSTQVSDTSNDDDDGPNRSKGAVVHFGGNRIPGKGQSIENYFMGALSVGGLGIMDARKYVMSTFAPGQQNIPEGGFATITNITMPRPDGVYSGTGQRLGNDLRMDADIYNQYIAGDGQTKVTQRTRMARVGQHIKEMYTDQGVTGMTVDVDERMINQIDEIDSARKGLRNDPNKNSYSITRRDDDGNENVVATVSKKVAEEIASGVDIEAAAFDYNLPDPPSVSQPQQEDDGPQPGESSTSDYEDDSAAYADYDSFFNDGGLASKKKPKPKKKMKRGGLASKK